MSSPNTTCQDLAEHVRQAFGWIEAGSEVGLYPYVVPFSGVDMARDPALVPQTVFERVMVPGTRDSWQQATKILPLDELAREVILEIESDFERAVATLRAQSPQLPSRIRSLLWVACAVGPLRSVATDLPSLEEVLGSLKCKLPVSAHGAVTEIHSQLRGLDEFQQVFEAAS